MTKGPVPRQFSKFNTQDLKIPSDFKKIVYPGVMTTASASGVDLPALAAQLDQDILDAERRLAELRALRQHTEQLLKYAFAVRSAVVHGQPSTGKSTKASLTDQVVQVFLDDPDAVLDADEVIARLRENGLQVGAGSVRNALYYAAGNYAAAGSHGLIKKGRGRFALRDSSTPVTTGVEVGEEPDSSSQEMGGLP
ncbi:hypothetical protein [Mycobacterium stomatepiae]|uniref:hypothetical protein n=1 Tax=Mycobacterium stomatepiae TaxID=470076 RepID=UPI0013D02A7F|nr:hypothetical protein [Mycobacterium stomatepiae]MCV7165604.1 hypothetical protein [Mycobacterium stomatepiae]